MTRLNRKVQRETEAFLALDRFTRGRPIIVELEPPDLVTFRFKGLKRRYTAPISKVAQWTIQADIERVRKEKAAQKKKRK